MPLLNSETTLKQTAVVMMQQDFIEHQFSILFISPLYLFLKPCTVVSEQLINGNVVPYLHPTLLLVWSAA